MSRQLTTLLQSHPRGCLALICAVVTGVLWCCVEAVFLAFLLLRGTGGLEWSEGGLTEPDPRLGFRARPNAHVYGKLACPGGAVSDCRYTTDAQHRRVTPVNDPEIRTRFALFFGCSYTFGTGVNDDETLPAQFGRFAPGFRPFNYGFPAYGPQNMYLIASAPEFAEDIALHDGIAVYTFIDHHVLRAAGSMLVGTTWGRDLPCFTLEEGRLAHHGSFESARPCRQLAYRFFRHLPSVQFSGMDWPPPSRASNIALTAALVRGAADALRARYPGLRFHVVVFPGQRLGGLLHDALGDAATEYSDYSQLLLDSDTARETWFFPDGHPKAALYEQVARRFAEDLKARESQGGDYGRLPDGSTGATPGL